MRLLPSIAFLALAAGLVVTSARADDTPPPPEEDATRPKGHDLDKPKVDPAKVAAERLAELIRKGTQACAAGEVDDGLTALDAAWAQREDVDLAVQLANCEIKAGQWPGAAEHLAFALRNKDDPAARKPLEAAFLNVRARVGAVKVKVTVDGADVFAGDRFEGQSPLPGEVYVSPGEAHVSAKKPGHGELDQVVAVQAGGTAEVTLDLTNESAAAASRRIPERRSMTPALVVGGVGLVAAGVGATFYAAGAVRGAAADSLLAELRTGGSSQPCAGASPARGCTTTLSSLRSGHDTFVNVGTGALAGGGALLAVGMVLGLRAACSTSSENRASLTIAPTVSASSVGIGAAGSF